MTALVPLLKVPVQAVVLVVIPRAVLRSVTSVATLVILLATALMLELGAATNVADSAVIRDMVAVAVAVAAVMVGANEAKPATHAAVSVIFRETARKDRSATTAAIPVTSLATVPPKLLLSARVTGARNLATSRLNAQRLRNQPKVRTGVGMVARIH